MTRIFVMTQDFDEEWKKLGLTDEELTRLQKELAKDPNAGDMIQGTHGCRKYRIPMEGRGKRGGGRVIYIDFIRFEKIYLITVYAKNEQENITKQECENIKKAVKDIELAERIQY